MKTRTMVIVVGVALVALGLSGCGGTTLPVTGDTADGGTVEYRPAPDRPAPVDGDATQDSRPAPGSVPPAPVAPGSDGETVAAPVRDEGAAVATSAVSYPVVDTGQSICTDADNVVDCATTAFVGQDAQHAGAGPSYADNGDGTVTDLVTGLMWQQDPGDKLTWNQAAAGADSFELAGYDDWRLPTIKELYSLIRFDGTDVSACVGACSAVPFIDTDYFAFVYGDESAGERTIDAQYWSSTVYQGTALGSQTAFGVNFADGRIKSYPIGAMQGGSEKTAFVLYVRGNPAYGENALVDNGDGTVSDAATGLMWQQADNGAAVTWGEALATCEAATTGGYDDWRLPNAKELQSIVDYARGPQSTGTAAIDPVFATSTMIDEGGDTNYPFFWTSTTHASSNGSVSNAAYIAFGEALGYMSGPDGSVTLMDVHGAGAQRADLKVGDAAAYPTGHGPQGDVMRDGHYVRCVRDGGVTFDADGVDGDGRSEVSFDSSTGSGGAGAAQGAPGGAGAAGGEAPAGEPPEEAPAGGLQGGTPPQPAMDACAGLSVGDACGFTSPQGEISGVCRDATGVVACAP